MADTAVTMSSTMSWTSNTPTITRAEYRARMREAMPDQDAVFPVAAAVATSIDVGTALLDEPAAEPARRRTTAEAARRPVAAQPSVPVLTIPGFARENYPRAVTNGYATAAVVMVMVAVATIGALAWAVVGGGDAFLPIVDIAALATSGAALLLGLIGLTVARFRPTGARDAVVATVAAVALLAFHLIRILLGG